MTIITTIISKPRADPSPAFYCSSNLNTNSSHARGSDCRDLPGGRAGRLDRTDILVQLHLHVEEEKGDMVETQCKNV